MRMLTSVLITMALAMTCTVHAFSQETKTVKIVRQSVIREFNPAFKDKREQAIESLEHQLADALRLKDTVKLDTLLSDTVLVAGFFADKKQFVTYLVSIDTKHFYSIEKSEMRIRVYGDTAVTTGIEKADIELKNGGSFLQSKFMNTWKRVGGKWRCIAISESSVLPI